MEEFNQNGAALHMQLDKPNFQVMLVQLNGIKSGDNIYNILENLLDATFDNHYQYYFREFFGENQYAVILAFDDTERNTIASRYQALKNIAIENDIVITYFIVYQQSNSGCYAGGQIVGQTIIADAFCSTRRREHINGASTVGYCDCSHRRTMDRTNDGKECHGASDQIARKESKEEKIAYQQNDSSGIAID